MLNDLPEISFTEKDINTIISDMIAGYEKAYFEQTGKVKKLYPGDPIRIFLYTQALRELQLRAIIDDSAKQNLLAYARRPYINHLAALKKIEEFEPQKATALERFRLSTSQAVTQTIVAGTRVSPGNNIYFEVPENAEIPAGQNEIDIVVRCLTPGTIGNNFTPGQINILVDPIPWIERVENLDTSQGGSDEEDVESFRERIWLAPESYSVAGPEEAYIFFTKQYSPLIQDVKVTSPSPGSTDIRFILKDGEIPTQTFIDGLLESVSAKDKRPLTDYVQGGAPNQVDYNIDLTYYIRSSDSEKSLNIQTLVQKAVGDYRVWQKSKIGRDINPSELTARILNAGAKRVEIIEPLYTSISNTEIGKDVLVSVNYGGLEDD